MGPEESPAAVSQHGPSRFRHKNPVAIWWSPCFVLWWGIGVTLRRVAAELAGLSPPQVVGTGLGKDDLLDAGCSAAASRRCTTWRHRDHHSLCRISYWKAGRGVAIYGVAIYWLACESGRNVPFKTALWAFPSQWWLPSYRKEGNY